MLSYLFGFTLFCCLFCSDGHSVWKQSFPRPKGSIHDKSEDYMKKLRHQRRVNANNYGDRFLEQYNKMMNKTNGYFSNGGVPYHSVETLICEAPDYGHETTSEAFSYYIWITSLYGWYSGDFSEFNTAWNMLESTLIPDSSNQPSDSIAAYNPETPAEYAPEEDTPSDYPVALDSTTPVGVDPLNDELAKIYGTDNTTLTEIYATHWLLDVDNIYGFGDQESGDSSDTNVFVNSFQRGPNESVWRTIPQPEWENLKYGDSQCGFQDLFTSDPNGCKAQWRYTGAPDADARTIQATYWAIQFAQNTSGGIDQISGVISKAQKLGDFLRYALWDKYFKTIPCHDPSCPGTTWSNSWNSTFYLISWYLGWGGNIGSYDWGWRIGASHVHQGYQNVMTAYALSSDPNLQSKTSGGIGQWQTVKDRTLEFWQWLQSSEGAIAGGATNSWKGRYLNPSDYGITGYFYGLAYDWQPVYHDPPSNNWFGMQVWSMERLAEYIYSSGDEGTSLNVLKQWIEWYNTDLRPNIFLNNSDWQVPSTLNWTGQPDTWSPDSFYTTIKEKKINNINIHNHYNNRYNYNDKKGYKNWQSNDNLHVTVINYSQDVGVGSHLAQLLAYYGKIMNDEQSQEDSAELLDRMYLYSTSVGISCEEERQDYIGNEYTQGFWEPVYVPTNYNGQYPNGDQIKSGDIFTDIRSWYKNDPMWNTVQSAKDSNTAPVFIYHRFWAQAAYAIACADYSRLYEN